MAFVSKTTQNCLFLTLFAVIGTSVLVKESRRRTLCKEQSENRRHNRVSTIEWASSLRESLLVSECER
jgi:hypothetical protein